MEVPPHQSGVMPTEFPIKNFNNACLIWAFPKIPFADIWPPVMRRGAMFEISHRKSNLKNRVEGATEWAVVELTTTFPTYG